MKRLLLLLGVLLLSLGMVVATCIESDGGYKIYTKGNATDTVGAPGLPAGTYNDTCFSSTVLKEYWCPANSSTLNVNKTTCTSACSDGKCTSVTPKKAPEDGDAVICCGVESSGKVVLVVILAVLLALVGLGYWFFRRKR